MKENQLAWNSKICDFSMLGFFGVSFEMHVHVFSIIISHSFFLVRPQQEHARTLSVLVLLLLKNQHGGHTRCIRVHNRKKGIFFKGKKSLMFCSINYEFCLLLRCCLFFSCFAVSCPLCVVCMFYVCLFWKGLAF